ESQWKCHPHSIITLWLDVDGACDPEVSLRPALIVALQIVPDLFPVHCALVVVLNAICKKIAFGANVPIESGQYKRGHIIAQSFRAELWRGRTSGQGCSRRRKRRSRHFRGVRRGVLS